MAREPRGKRRERSHKPAELGPCIIERGRWLAVDLRPWGGGRPTLKNPKHPRWPAQGDRTEDHDIARRWAWSYVDDLTADRRVRQLGRKPRRAESVRDAGRRWLEHRSQTVAPNTYSISRSMLTHLTDYYGEGKNVHDIDDLQPLFAKRIAAGYAPGTLHTLRQNCSVFFKWLGYEGAGNPATLVELPTEATTDVVTWSEPEIEQLRKAADYADREPWRAQPIIARRLLEVLLATGARQMEAFALQWSDFDPDACTVRFQVQCQRNSGALVPLKGKLARTALVLPEWWDCEKQSPPAKDDHREFLFARNDHPLGYRTQVNIVNRILDAAQLGGPGVRFHIFRHTYARRFIELGGRFEELQKSLGHKSITTTEQTYGHFHEDIAASLARGRIYRDEPLRVMK